MCNLRLFLKDPLVVNLSSPGPLTSAMFLFLHSMREAGKGPLSPKVLFSQLCQKYVLCPQAHLSLIFLILISSDMFLSVQYLLSFQKKLSDFYQAVQKTASSCFKVEGLLVARQGCTSSSCNVWPSS